MFNTDKNLVQQFIQGDTGAQKQFVEKYKNWIIGVTIKKFKLDIFKAEELFQIVLLSLIDNDHKVLKAWQGQGKFSTYLTVIVTRACIKYVAKNKNNISLDESDYQHKQVDESTSPEDFADTVKKLELIQSYFLELKSRDQLLLSYRFVDELEPSEIAEILNMKAATVRKAIHDALHRLRNKLPFNVTLIVLSALIGKYK